MDTRRLAMRLTLLGACALAIGASGCEGTLSNPDAGSVDAALVHDAARGDAGDAGSAADAGDTGSADRIGARFFNVVTDEVDPRFPDLPSTLPIVRLLPRVTFQAEVAPSARSVRLTVDGTARLDVVAPFRFDEDAAGAATVWDAAVGAHTILIETYASSDGSGVVTGRRSFTLTLTADGSDGTPATGEHTVHRLWITSAGDYVHRNAGGDFLDPAGTVVLRASQVHVDDRGAGQVFLVSDAGLPTLDFAFIVLLPDGFDETVAYPLLLLLHHGWEAYRGTDSDDLLLEQPPLVGDRSIVSSALRHEFPAIVLVPQLHFHDAIAGVNNEWAAFTRIDGTTGQSFSAPDPSVGARYALDILDDLIASTLPIDGMHTTVDTARLYMTGHSMGGLGTWDLVARQPNFWAAAIPMAGFPDFDRAAALVDTPIWAFHHRIDCYNTFAGSETMHRLITEVHGGTRMRLSAMTFDTGGACDQAHFQTPDHAFADTELLPWIFSQVNGRR